MQLDLFLGDRAYSSWSMRIGLLVDRFGLPVTCHVTPLYTEAFSRKLEQIAPARTVPALRLPGGPVITESVAIAEELASRFPEAGLWPADPTARAVARGLMAEMHAGFADLRRDFPMNLRTAYADVDISQAVTDDLARIDTVWRNARAVTRASGPWLCGTYSIADAFYAPIAARVAGYGLPLSAEGDAYVAAHLIEPSFIAWRTLALAYGPEQPGYEKPWRKTHWPSSDTPLGG